MSSGWVSFRLFDFIDLVVCSSSGSQSYFIDPEAPLESSLGNVFNICCIRAIVVWQ